MPFADGSGPPVVCTLTTGERTVRVLEWGDLAELALTSEPIPSGMAFTYPLAIAAEIDDLADRERNCCGTWLDVVVTRLDDAVGLELTTANPDGLSMILEIAGHPSADPASTDG